MSSRTRLIIADDQRLFAENLKAVMDIRIKDFEVVGIAKDGAEACELVRLERPEMVLMDIRMPVLDGVEATGVIHHEFPEVTIIVLTTFEDDGYVHEAIRRGAKGYLLKSIQFENLIESLRAARSGTALFSPSVLLKFVQTAESDKSSAKEPAPDWVKGLGRREKAILRLLVQGLNNQEIAEKLFISVQTVKNYVYSIYGKIGVHSRLGVIQVVQANADQWGLPESLLETPATRKFST